jgi:hypothetical protein
MAFPDTVMKTDTGVVILKIILFTFCKTCLDYCQLMGMILYTQDQQKLIFI